MLAYAWVELIMWRDTNETKMSFESESKDNCFNITFSKEKPALCYLLFHFFPFFFEYMKLQITCFFKVNRKAIN